VSAFVINSYAFGGEDPDAKAYLDAVEAADTQALEAAVRKAVDDFVKGCKADGIWSAIKASCIMAGARTLEGALTPLVGSAPTNAGGSFVSGDYDRKTGLKSNGSTKRLGSNRANNADPQDSKHIAVWQTASEDRSLNPASPIGNVFGGSVAFLSTNQTTRFARINSGNFGGGEPDTSVLVGLWGGNRSGSTALTQRFGGTNYSYTVSSSAPSSDEIWVFARNNTAFTPARVAFYSIGESIDLADLDTRVGNLMSDLDAAI
jgi:hypothetical protein